MNFLQSLTAEDAGIVFGVTVTVTDGGNRQMEASGSVPIYAASLRLGYAPR